MELGGRWPTSPARKISPLLSCATQAGSTCASAERGADTSRRVARKEVGCAQHMGGVPGLERAENYDKIKRCPKCVRDVSGRRFREPHPLLCPARVLDDASRVLYNAFKRAPHNASPSHGEPPHTPPQPPGRAQTEPGIRTAAKSDIGFAKLRYQNPEHVSPSQPAVTTPSLGRGGTTSKMSHVAKTGSEHGFGFCAKNVAEIRSQLQVWPTKMANLKISKK
jgi:hypothetical protein